VIFISQFMVHATETSDKDWVDSVNKKVDCGVEQRNDRFVIFVC